MYSKTITISIMLVFLVMAAAGAHGQTPAEEGISVLGFIPHRSALHEWNDEECAKLQRMLTETLAKRGLPVREVTYEFPESLSATSEAQTLIEEVWTDLSRFRDVRYWVAGSIEIHKGGGSSCSLLLLDSRTRTVRRMDPVRSEASSRETVAEAIPKLSADLGRRVELALRDRD